MRAPPGVTSMSADAGISSGSRATGSSSWSSECTPTIRSGPSGAELQRRQLATANSRREQLLGHAQGEQRASRREIGGQLRRQLDLHADLLARRVELDLQRLAQWLCRIGEHGRRVRSRRHAVTPRPLAAQQLERPEHAGVDPDLPGVGLGGAWRRPASRLLTGVVEHGRRGFALALSGHGALLGCGEQPALGGQLRAGHEGDGDRRHGDHGEHHQDHEHRPDPTDRGRISSPGTVSR